MKNLIIIGVGGLAREVYDLLPDSIGYEEKWRLKGFLDGDVHLEEAAYQLLYAPLLGAAATYEIEPDDVFLCAVADPKAKRRLTECMESRGGAFINLIHRTAAISKSAQLGRGIIFYGHTGISCNTRIGDHVMIGAYSGIGHDAKIGAYTSVMSYVNITGGAIVEEATYWGSGSRALPNSRIEKGCVVGAGSVVLKRVKAGQTVFGVPATPIS